MTDEDRVKVMVVASTVVGTCAEDGEVARTLAAGFLSLFESLGFPLSEAVVEAWLKSAGFTPSTGGKRALGTLFN